MAEAFDLTLEVAATTDPIFAAYLPFDTVAGSSTPTDWNPAELSTELIISATVAPTEAKGIVVWATTGGSETPTEPHPIDWYQRVNGVAEFSLERVLDK